ncbi:hypothetical protein Scep_022342 [Stephania cephalantha]|uniref:Uncharacterized protein n=1 Tax=Stephania cephalantha TaxID=152367 RepID=A0AAP0FA94_9MAGN
MAWRDDDVVRAKTPLKAGKSKEEIRRFENAFWSVGRPDRLDGLGGVTLTKLDDAKDCPRRRQKTWIFGVETSIEGHGVTSTKLDDAKDCPRRRRKTWIFGVETSIEGHGRKGCRKLTKLEAAIQTMPRWSFVHGAPSIGVSPMHPFTTSVAEICSWRQERRMWCQVRMRHHLSPQMSKGKCLPLHYDNANVLDKQCNKVKQLMSWRARPTNLTQKKLLRWWKVVGHFQGAQPIHPFCYVMNTV